MYTVTINGAEYRTCLTANGAYLALRGLRWLKYTGSRSARGWYEIRFKGKVVAQGMV